MYRKDRVKNRDRDKERDNDRNYGGVLILVSQNLISSDPGIPVPGGVEMVWAQIQIAGSKKLYICSYYKPPGTDAEDLKELNNVLQTLDPTSNHIWIAGDFNLGHIDWESQSTRPSSPNRIQSELLIEIAQDHGLHQCVTQPTRVTETPSSLLDLFFTNTPDMVNRCEVKPGFSDHDIPLLDISTRIKHNKQAPRKIHLFNKADNNGIIQSLETFKENLSRDAALLGTEEIWQKIKSAILDAMDTFIPSKTITSSKKSLPWITRPIKKDIQKKERLYKLAKKTNTEEDRRKFIQQRAHVQKTLRKAHQRYIEDSITGGDNPNCTGDIQKNFWRHIKAAKKDRTGTAPLKENGLLVSDAKGKADILNRQYQSVFSKEDPHNIPHPDSPPQQTMPDISVQEAGVHKMLLGLKTNKASGPDSIPPRVLKLAAEPLSTCLTLLFNSSLKSGITPSDWKTANITPVYKKGERFKAENYRPVSLTCICSKMLEHIVVSQLMKHLDNHNILSDCQHGFRAKRSCESQLLSLTQELHEHLEEREQIDMIVLDFSKAFDKVAHHRLLAKLENYGVRGSLHKWIASFLLDRKQRVVVDGKNSDWVKVDSGVPQGTVLGPILFLAFINDLPSAVKSSVRLFADDCVMYRPVHSQEDCRLLQEDLDKLSEWEDKWCMKFNATKCNSITITRRKNIINHEYTLHGIQLEKVDSAAYLGVELSADLTWARHMNKTCAKANKSLAFLRRNLQVQSKPLKEMAYKGIVRPVLEYCSPIWNPHHKKYTQKLEMVQRRAARFVLQRHHNTSSVTDMLKSLEWESLASRRTKSSLTIFFKIQHSLIAIPPPAFVCPSLRPRPGSPHQLQIPFCQTDSYKNSFFPRTIRQWNSLPSPTATLSSLPSFKAALSSMTF